MGRQGPVSLYLYQVFCGIERAYSAHLRYKWTVVKVPIMTESGHLLSQFQIVTASYTVACTDQVASLEPLGCHPVGSQYIRLCTVLYACQQYHSAEMQSVRLCAVHSL